MKAITFQGKQQVSYSSIPDPYIVNPTDAIVKVYIAGLCGSDLHIYHQRETGIDCGTAMGHEFVGEIVETGKQVQNFKKGDVVISPFTSNCGQCYFCSIGLTCRCIHNQLYGWVENGKGLHGGQAEYVRVPFADYSLIRLKENLSAKTGLLLGDNFSTGYYCAEQAEPKPKDCCVVIGCGSVGLMAVLSLQILGVQQMFAIDSVAERLQKATLFGAKAINFKKENTQKIIEEATKGIGADAVLEVVGSPSASRLAMDLVRPGGVISTVGVHTTNQFAFSPVEAYDKNLTFKIGRCPARYYMEKLIPKAAELDEKIHSVITHEFALKNGVSAYAVFDQKADACIKAILKP